MPYLKKAQPARQIQSTQLTKQSITPISPQAAIDTMMALYSDARRQLDAIELFLSSYEDKVRYLNDISYGAWLGAEWRIQLPTLAKTLTFKVERIYLPMLSAVAMHPTCGSAIRTALRGYSDNARGRLEDLANLDSILVKLPPAEASTRNEVAALRAAEITCRGLVIEFEDTMYVLDRSAAEKWTDHCLKRPSTMVPNSPQYRWN